jgi:hypothetical protein
MEAFKWKKSDGKDDIVLINSLEELSELLKGMPIVRVETEIEINVIKGRLKEWIENNFSGQMILCKKIDSAVKEFTAQQIRELLVRELKGK